MPEPKIADYLETARQGGTVVDKVADYNRGSDYESLSGPNAILWSRQSQRDTDLWRATRFNDAQGPDLTRAAEGRFGIARVLDARGQGTATLTRPTASAGAGTVYRGTRIRVQTGSHGVPTYYRVTSDEPVGATVLVVVVSIEAVKLGAGSKIASGANNYLDDNLWDSTWTVSNVACEDGTRLESAPEYRARIRDERLAARVGQEDAIIDACELAGASNVAIFRSDYAGIATDIGLNFAYVGDLGYSSSPELVRACTLALRAIRVAGDNMQVLPMTRASLAIDADIYLRDSPQVLPVSQLEVVHRRAFIHHLDGRNGSFTYTLSGIESSILRTSLDVQDVRLVLPASDASVRVGNNFPDFLNRYFVEDNNIVIRYHGPE